MTISAFITEVEDVATEVEQGVVAGLKDGIDYVDNAFTTQLGPELFAALKGALAVFEQTALATLITTNTPSAPPSS